MLALSQLLSFLLCPILIAACFIQSQRLHRARLQKWALERRFELLEAKPCFIVRGPFQWTASRHQSVYRISIRDGQGQPFSGWVCMGHFNWLLPNELRAEWDGLQKPRSF